MQQYNSDLKKGALLKRIYEFLAQRSVMVLSTVAVDNVPESEMLDYVIEEDFSIYFCTSKEARKYENLTNNSDKVALVVGFYEELTLQYEGVAKLVKEKEIPELISKQLREKGRKSHKSSGRDFVYFKIMPRFLRMTDVSESPWSVNEVRIDV